MPQHDFLELCKARGFLHQCTDEAGLSALMREQSIPAYIGFDCTAPSLHVGSLVQIMMLRWLQKCGHKPIVLMGGGTTKVGDPSGKDEARKMLTDKQIAANMASIKRVFEKFLIFESSHPELVSGSQSAEMLKHVQHDGNYAIMVNNDDWLKSLNYIEFLRDYGRHFSVNRMMSMESVKQRLERESHLSFLEFNYMILQAYDFVELNQRFGCRLQIGGSDQWGNIVMGAELNRRLSSLRGGNADEAIHGSPRSGDAFARDDEDLFGLTSPLITTASGAKMGKTAQGAVWLNYDEKNTDFSKSPYDYWQFWRNTEDADVGRFLRLFTELPIEEIATLETLEGAHINEAKIILANEATTLLHGTDAAREAAETARKVFEQGGIGEALPEFTLPAADFQAGIPLFQLLQKAELAESGKKARQLIKDGAVKLNDVKATAEDYLVTAKDLMPEGHLKLSAGKKRHALVKAA